MQINWLELKDLFNANKSKMLMIFQNEAMYVHPFCHFKNSTDIFKIQI